MRKTSLIFISSIILFILINASLAQAGYVWIKVQYDDSCPTYWADVLTLVEWPNNWDPFGTTNTSGICDRKDLPPNTVYQVQAWYGVPGHEFGDLTPYETDSNGNGHVIITGNAERGGPCPCGLNAVLSNVDQSIPSTNNPGMYHSSAQAVDNPSTVDTAFSDTDYNGTNVSDGNRYTISVVGTTTATRYKDTRFSFNITPYGNKTNWMRYCMRGYYTNTTPGMDWAKMGANIKYYNVTSSSWVSGLNNFSSTDKTYCQDFTNAAQIADVTDANGFFNVSLNCIAYANDSVESTTCLIDFASLTVDTIISSSMAFGNVSAGTTSTNQTINIKNTGTANTVEFRVFGTNWTGTSNTMPVGQTSVYDTAWNNLTASHGEPTPGVNIFSGHINSGETKNIQFKVAIPAGQATDTYNQTITFTGSC